MNEGRNWRPYSLHTFYVLTKYKNALTNLMKCQGVLL